MVIFRFFFHSRKSPQKWEYPGNGVPPARSSSHNNIRVMFFLRSSLLILPKSTGYFSGGNFPGNIIFFNSSSSTASSRSHEVIPASTTRERWVFTVVLETFRIFPTTRSLFLPDHFNLQISLTNSMQNLVLLTIKIPPWKNCYGSILWLFFLRKYFLGAVS